MNSLKGLNPCGSARSDIERPNEAVYPVDFLFQTYLGYNYTLFDSEDLEVWKFALYDVLGDGKRWSHLNEQP